MTEKTPKAPPMNPDLPVTEAPPMAETTRPNAVKHGAFSDILILPGEDPQAYEKLKAELIAEFAPSGRAERAAVEDIALATWQLGRLRLYERVEEARLRRSEFFGKAPPGEHFFDTYLKSIGQYEPRPKSKEPPPPPPSDEDKLVKMGKLISLEHLEKELAVSARVEAKIDRGLKRLLSIRGIKSLSTATTVKAVTDQTPIIDLAAEKEPERE